MEEVFASVYSAEFSAEAIASVQVAGDGREG